MIAAAVCPHPPLLLPEAAGGAARELDELRSACDRAVARLLAAEPDTVLVVGAAKRTGWHGPDERGSFRPYGVDTVVSLRGDRPAPPAGDADEEVELPLSLAVGAWLLGRGGADRPCRGRAVAADEPPASCVRLGAALPADEPGRVALLVMGDGSACRGVQAPGYDDPRAAAYDDGVAAALADADADALLDLDPVLSAQLKVAGRAPWQLLAGAVRAAGGAWRGTLDHYAAPYGVAYFVATWEPV